MRSKQRRCRACGEGVLEEFGLDDVEDGATSALQWLVAKGVFWGCEDGRVRIVRCTKNAKMGKVQG